MENYYSAEFMMNLHRAELEVEIRQMAQIEQAKATQSETDVVVAPRRSLLSLLAGFGAKKTRKASAEAL